MIYSIIPYEQPTSLGIQDFDTDLDVCKPVGTGLSRILGEIHGLIQMVQGSGQADVYPAVCYLRRVSAPKVTLGTRSP